MEIIEMETMEKFRIVQEIKNLYSDLRDWLQYSDVMKNVKNTWDKVKRYAYIYIM